MHNTLNSVIDEAEIYLARQNKREIQKDKKEDKE